MEKRALTAIFIVAIVLLFVEVSHATTITIDPIGDSTYSGLDISSIDYSYTATTYTQTVYFNNQIDLSIEFWLDTSFTIDDALNDYTRTTTSNYYNKGDGTGYGSAHGFNTQYLTTIYTVGINYISAEFVRNENYTSSNPYDSWNVAPESYSIVSVIIVMVNDGGNWEVCDSIENASAPVPEPVTLLLYGTGLAGLAVGRRKQKNKGILDRCEL